MFTFFQPINCFQMLKQLIFILFQLFGVLLLRKRNFHHLSSISFFIQKKRIIPSTIVYKFNQRELSIIRTIIFMLIHSSRCKHSIYYCSFRLLANAFFILLYCKHCFDEMSIEIVIWVSLATKRNVFQIRVIKLQINLN